MSFFKIGRAGGNFRAGPKKIPSGGSFRAGPEIFIFFRTGGWPRPILTPPKVRRGVLSVRRGELYTINNDLQYILRSEAFH